MPTTFKTSDSKLAYICRRAQRAGSEVTVTVPVRGHAKEVTGHVVDVDIIPNVDNDLTWEITIESKGSG